MTHRTFLEPASAFAEIARIDLSQHTLDQVLARVSELAKASVPGAVEVSVTLLRAGRPATAAFTGPLALTLDEQQYANGYGPCLDAAMGGVTLVVTDMRGEQRWPEYAPRACGAGVLSSVSVSLPVQHAMTGALNVYGYEPDAFDDGAVSLAQTFAGYMAVALVNANLVEMSAALAEQMQQAMASRAVIEQAKGILVAQTGCSPEQAFGLLTVRSQHANRKLRDIASAIVEGAQVVPAPPAVSSVG